MWQAFAALAARWPRCSTASLQHCEISICRLKRPALNTNHRFGGWAQQSLRCAPGLGRACVCALLWAFLGWEGLSMRVGAAESVVGGIWDVEKIDRVYTKNERQLIRQLFMRVNLRLPRDQRMGWTESLLRPSWHQEPNHATLSWAICAFMNRAAVLQGLHRIEELGTHKNDHNPGRPRVDTRHGCVTS